MDKKILSIAIRVFEREDTKRIHEIIHNLVPLDFEKEKLKIIDQKVSDAINEELTVVGFKVEKQRHVKELWKHLMGSISTSDKRTMIDQISSRVDEEGHFYMRFDKNQMLNAKFLLTDSGDCFHFTINVAAYPKTKQKAEEIISELLREHS